MPTTTTTTTTSTTTQIEWTMVYNFTGTTSSIKEERYKEYSGENYDWEKKLPPWDKEILKQTEMWAN